MTPAKLLALEEARRDVFALQALATDKLAWMYVNAKRYPGKTDERGVVIEPPAPEIPLEDVMTFRPRRALAAKDRNEPEWDSALQGARANREAFSAWAGQVLGQVFVPTMEA